MSNGDVCSASVRGAVPFRRSGVESYLAIKSRHQSLRLDWGMLRSTMNNIFVREKNHADTRGTHMTHMTHMTPVL